MKYPEGAVKSEEELSRLVGKEVWFVYENRWWPQHDTPVRCEILRLKDTTTSLPEKRPRYRLYFKPRLKDGVQDSWWLLKGEAYIPPSENSPAESCVFIFTNFWFAYAHHVRGGNSK